MHIALANFYLLSVTGLQCHSTLSPTRRVQAQKSYLTKFLDTCLL